MLKLITTNESEAAEQQARADLSAPFDLFREITRQTDLENARRMIQNANDAAFRALYGDRSET